jgi:hypothetical protein
VVLDELLVVEVVLDDEVDQPVDQCEVRARLDRQVAVGQHRRLRDARVDDDERRTRVLLQAPAENRVVLGDVGADQQDDVGLLQILVGAWRSVAAERALVAGYRGRHAERGVAVVVRRTDAELHQLAERVELLGDELARADHADRVRTVFLLHRPELRRHHLQRLVPGDALHLAVAAQQRILGAVVGADRVMLRQPLRAEHAAIHRVVGVAAHAHRLAVLDADEHPAADGAVAAGGRDPLVRDLLRGEMADDRIDAVGVAIGASVESEHLFQGHAASRAVARYGAARCLGTTLTKNK